MNDEILTAYLKEDHDAILNTCLSNIELSGLEGQIFLDKLKKGPYSFQDINLELAEDILIIFGKEILQGNKSIEVNYTKEVINKLYNNILAQKAFYDDANAYVSELMTKKGKQESLLRVTEEGFRDVLKFASIQGIVGYLRHFKKPLIVFNELAQRINEYGEYLIKRGKTDKIFEKKLTNLPKGNDLALIVLKLGAYHSKEAKRIYDNKFTKKHYFDKPFSIN